MNLLASCAAAAILTLSLSACSSGGGSGGGSAATGAPIVISAVADRTVQIGETQSVNTTANVFSDPDGDSLTYNITINNSNGFSATGSSATGWTLSGQAINAGVTTVTTTAIDSTGRMVEDVFTITTQQANPVISNRNLDLTFSTGDSVDYDASQGGTTFTDLQSDPLTYSVSISPDGSGLVTDGPNITGTLLLAGTYVVEITADDGSGNLTTDSFDIVTSDANAARPNILFIISDDHGQDSSAQYNIAGTSDTPNTPTLDALAANGLIFDNAWVTPICAPTRATLITGKYSFETDVTDVDGGNNVLNTNVHDTLFDYMGTNAPDYASALIGKWHIGGGNTGPRAAGIDHYVVITNGGVGDYSRWDKNDNGNEAISTSYVTTDFTDEAIDWIDDQTDPWLLWLAHIAPHSPFHVPPTTLQSRVTSTASSNRELYLASVEAMDSEIDRLLDSMSAEQRANTIVVFLGDNGTPGQVDPGNGDSLNGAKGDLFEGGMRVPMIVSGDLISRTGREDALINGTDFLNTFLDLTGGAQAPLPNSQSFADLLTNSDANTREYIFTESPDGWAIRDEQYKLIQFNNGRQDLFDLTNDPDESADLIGGPIDVSAIVTRLENARPT